MEARDKKFFETFNGKTIKKWSICEYKITKIGEITKEDTGYEDAECECEITETYTDKVTGKHEEKTINGTIFYHDFAGWSVRFYDSYGKINQ